MWCIGQITGDYLANMEDILDIYASPALPGIVRLCFDERPCQLLDNVLTPIPPKAGQTKKEHQEYIRNGVCNVLLAYNIDTGQRHIQVTETKKRKDYALFMKELALETYPNAQKIVIIQDNYNTHTKGSFYENLDTPTAHTLSKKFDFHFTPKHASWLNMAEIEFSALSRQCLDRRIKDIVTLTNEANIWKNDRNNNNIKINWSFTTDKARTKLANRYKEVIPKQQDNNQINV